MKNKKMKYFIIITIVITVIICAFLLIPQQKYANKQLTSYRYSRSGDMQGSHYLIELVKINENETLLSYSQADWYNQKPQVKEYLLSSKVFDEIKEIFLKYRIYNWHNKKFTNMFIADGATDSYAFRFLDTTISFSSQLFPTRYSRILTQIDEIIQKYQNNSQQLPALSSNSPNETINTELTNGQLQIAIHSYYQNTLTIQVINGQNNKYDLQGKIELFDTSNNIIIQNEENLVIAPNSLEEIYLKTPDHLVAGHYIIKYANLTADFEIK